jgi:peptidoglycan biosynthesis protein MviN/MurJ (putative lipid II flippase)
LLTGAFFICFIKNGVNYLVASDKQSTVFIYVVISLLVTVAVTVAAVKMNFNIQGIAVGTVAGSLVLTTLIWKSVFKKFGYPLRRQWEKIFQLYTPCFFMLAFIVLLSGTMKKYFAAIAVNPGVTIPLFAALYFLMLYSVPHLRLWSSALLKELGRQGSGF